MSKIIQLRNTDEIREIFALYHNMWIDDSNHYVPIELMETSDIKDCIKKIYKSNGGWRNKFLRLFERELRNRKFRRLNMATDSNTIDTTNDFFYC